MCTVGVPPGTGLGNTALGYSGAKVTHLKENVLFTTPTVYVFIKHRSVFFVCLKSLYMYEGRV